MKFFAKTFAAAAVVAVAGIGSLSVMDEAHAAFDICKKVRISVKNNTGGPVKLFDLDYRDYGSNRKRSENISNRVIANGKSYSWTRNLEGVNNARTHITAQYSRLKSNGKWHVNKYWYANSAASTCKRGKSYQIVLR